MVNFVRTLKWIIFSQRTMSGSEGRGNLLKVLNSPESEKLVGSGLSKRFSKLPLWLSHPSNIGGFYGLLVSLALILPYYKTEEFWVPLWIFHASLLVFAAALLGMFSRILSSFFYDRLPISPNRKILYPMPFVGFTLFTLLSTDLLPTNVVTLYLAWGLLLIPGPLYVHLSWAPRWRILCMIEDGVYEHQEYEENIDDETLLETLAEEDSDLLEVVESLESEEE